MAKQTEFLNPAEAAAILWALEIALTENLELTTLSNLGVAFSMTQKITIEGNSKICIDSLSCLLYRLELLENSHSQE
ncbi:hypothetical protein FCV25MIE_17289, partial [Fagus crenata]